jgi:hypothetical protein
MMSLNSAENRLAELRQRLLSHPIYAEIDTLEKARIFMQHHVFAVWDFMSLLTRLQQELTTVRVPWVPYRNATFTRFINEIVLAEESDEDGRGGYSSHFLLYMDAMRELGADGSVMESFLGALQAGKEATLALKQEKIPESVATFVQSTLQIAKYGQVHEVAAAFFYGREDLIPEMFERLLAAFESQGVQYERLKYYLRRHMELDGDHHGPLAAKLLDNLCDNDDLKRLEALQIAIRSIEARIALWDGVVATINPSNIIHASAEENYRI